MDNLCHTLVGATLGEAGLKKHTALGMATLLIGANLPDVDALSYFASPVTALGFRRGWTHGLPAVAVWPLVLTGLVMAWDRYVRRRRQPELEPANPRSLLLLSFLSVLTHPLLDFCNTYGMRWLMPFSDRWSYGDTLFILDPWIWLALTAGYYVSSRRDRRGAPRPDRAARAALALVAAYMLLMSASNVVARAIVGRDLRGGAAAPAAHLMVAPAFANPFRRDLVLDAGAAYRLGRIDWLSRRMLTWEPSTVPTGEALAEARAAAATPGGRTFLRWARFPYYGVRGAEGCPSAHVCIFDARYYPQTWAQVAIALHGRLSSSRPSSHRESP